MEQPILNINGRKLPISITPPKSKDTKINEYLNDYTIKRARVTEYRPRSDCGNCMAHYHLAKRLNSRKEKEDTFPTYLLIALWGFVVIVAIYMIGQIQHIFFTGCKNGTITVNNICDSWLGNETVANNTQIIPIPRNQMKP